MREALILLAGIGLALGWHRAKPVKPARDWTIITLDKIRAKAPRIKTLASFLIGLLGCAECLTPYFTLALSLCMGYGSVSLLHAIAAYGLYCVFFVKEP